MENFVDVYYKERDGRINRDVLHGGKMLKVTCTSHGGICDLQEEIIKVESSVDIIYNKIGVLNMTYSIKVLEEYTNISNDVINIIKKYIFQSFYRTLENTENIKQIEQTIKNFKEKIIRLKKYHKWLRNREEVVVDIVENMCNLDKYKSEDSE